MPTLNKILKSLFGPFTRIFRKEIRPDPAYKIMLQSLARTEEREISCDEVYSVIDQFAEAAVRGEDVLVFMPLVRQHLDMCPDCREEYEALLRMLQPAEW